MLHTIDEIVASTLGTPWRYWFDDDTLDYFSSIVYPAVFAQEDGSYFITSEQHRHDDPRLFSVRFCTLHGQVKTVGEFQAHETFEDAVRAIREDAAFQWKRDVPIWAVLRFMEAVKSIPGLMMTGWKETAKGGKLTTYDPLHGIVTGQMYK